MRVLNAVKEMFFPSKIKCLCCGKELMSGLDLDFCDTCKPTRNLKFCIKCGRAMSNMSSYCNSCTTTPNFFENARAPFCYEDETVARLVKLYKFHNHRYLSDFMVKAMLESYEKEGWTVQAVTFVPSSPKKEKQRGFNQAEFLARKIAKELSLPLKEYLFKEDSKELKNLNKSERIKAISGSISLNWLMPDEKLHSILLVDDVFTTGTTVNECARLIKKNFADKVFVLSFATSKAH